VLAHRIDDPEAVLSAHRAADRQRRIPAHRIAGDRGDVEAAAVDGEEIGEGGGEDERRGDVASGVERGTEALRPVELGEGGLAACGPDLVEAFDQLPPARMVAAEIAQLGLAVRASSRADHQRRFPLSHAPSPAPRRRWNRGSAG
jgi:hypothetical protein